MDGIDKIEVKSTSKSHRIHKFSYDQLSPTENTNLIISSIFVIQSGIGKNIFDLKEDIETQICSLELRYKLNEIIFRTTTVQRNYPIGSVDLNRNHSSDVLV